MSVENPLFSINLLNSTTEIDQNYIERHGSCNGNIYSMATSNWGDLDQYFIKIGLYIYCLYLLT